MIHLYDSPGTVPIFNIEDVDINVEPPMDKRHRRTGRCCWQCGIIYFVGKPWTYPENGIWRASL